MNSSKAWRFIVKYGNYDNYNNYDKKRYSVTKVEFYANDVLIGSDDSSPYYLKDWKPKSGSYTIEANIFYNEQTKMSNPIKIKVGN